MTDQARQTHLAIKHLGLFNAFFNSGVLFNSIVFRIVVGVLGAIPPESVAIVTMLEYTLNCILEVPLGYFADRFGRVRSAVAGLVLIMLGLTSIYMALVVPDQNTKLILIALDGIFLGVGKPLMSGSVEAFYQDTILRLAKGSPDLELAASRSFTRSLKFGKHMPLVATIVALPTLYLLNKTYGAEHALLPGIATYLYVIYRILYDLKRFGEPSLPPILQDAKAMLRTLAFSIDARKSIAIRIAFQLINSIISGYLIISLLRYAEATALQFFWPLLLSFTVATALSASIRGYILSGLLDRLGETRYIAGSFALHICTAAAMLPVVRSASPVALTIGVFWYTTVFYVTQGALRSVSTNLISSAVDSKHQATAMSIANMPGFLVVGLYGLYLAAVRNGAPSVFESFLTTGIVSLTALIVVSTCVKGRAQTAVNSTP